MKQHLRRISTALFLCPLLFSITTSAQIKGDPAFNGVPEQQTAQKPSSNLSPDLKKLSAAYQAQKTKSPQAMSRTKPGTGVEDFNKYMQIKGDKVVVDITAKEEDIAAAKAELQKLGATITATYGRVISAIIPIASLPQLENVTSIRFARPAYRPLHVQQHDLNTTRAFSQATNRAFAQATAFAPFAPFAPKAPKAPKAPPIISQGDTAQLSYLARKKYKVEGRGVKVGVLSDSYNNLGTADSGIAQGELPGPGNPFGYRTPVEVLSDLSGGGTDEGRAMLEIVHDVAPAAPLAFHTADNGQADFASGILQLAHKGCSVIADDVLYYAEPFFQDGIIAQAIDQAKQQGVTYFSSAGNSSLRSYESPYRSTKVSPFGPVAGTAHNFSGPSDPPRFYQPIYIPPGGLFISSFQWDNSSFAASGVGATTDLDIYLLDSLGNIVAVGGTDNIASGEPVEVFGYINNSPNSTFYLVIVKFAGTDPTQLKYILFGDALFYLTNPAIPGILSPTLVGHTKAEGAISTGAAYYKQTPPYGVEPPVLEFFSSVGGVPNYFDIKGHRIAPLIRKKPEIVAPDGGFNSLFNPFFGTSAAAPHAAGVAALMIEAQKLKTITPSQIKGILTTHTWDMENPYTPGSDKGFNFATGYGLIKATGAVGEVKFPHSYIKNLELSALCSPNPSVALNWRISNPNPFDVPVNWQISGTNQHGTLTVAPGDTTFSTTPIYLFQYNNQGNQNDNRWYRNSSQGNQDNQGYGNQGNQFLFQFPAIAIISWEDNFLFSHFDLAFGNTSICGQDQASDATSNKPLLTTGKTLQNGKPALSEVYPNPSDGLFKLYLSTGQQDVTLGLYSADGQQLMTRRVPGAMTVIDIDATAYRPGVYFLKVTQGNDVKTIKLIRK